MSISMNSATLVAFCLAMVLGVLVALMRTSGRPVLVQVATFYTELLRGVPILVFLFFAVAARGTGMGRELARQLSKEGAHVAMCDGSVTSLSDHVTPIVIQSLISRSNGEVIRDQDLR